MNALLIALLLSLATPPTPGAVASGARAPAARGAVTGPASARPPDVVILDRVEGCYGSVRFDHRVHVQMTSITSDCRACHHDLPEPADTTGPVRPRACRDCHDAASTITREDKPGLRGAYHRQCLSCHKDWSHENACGFCHTAKATPRMASTHSIHLAAGRTAPRATYVYQTGHKALPVVTFHHDDHSERFGLSCADCHGGTSCGSCHGGKAERPAVNREQSCYGCHSESRCVTCHSTAERGKFDHGTRTHWYLRPGHASLACDACHTDVRTPERPDSETCGACHAKRYEADVFDHARTGVTLRGDHALYDCLDCHRGGNEGMLASCSSCHTDRPPIGERSVGCDPERRHTGAPRE